MLKRSFLGRTFLVSALAMAGALPAFADAIADAMAEVQKYFDKAVYPIGTKKGYKGVIIMELSFDEKGKIIKSTIIQGLCTPYDIVILDLAKKMPNWEAPAPYGEPFASTRVITVEVTVR